MQIYCLLNVLWKNLQSMFHLSQIMLNITEVAEFHTWHRSNAGFKARFRRHSAKPTQSLIVGFIFLPVEKQIRVQGI